CFLSVAVLFAVVLTFAVPSLYAQSNVKAAQLTFTTIDVPGAMNTSVLAINSLGQMVGYYYNGTGATSTGFLLSAGKFSFFSYPGADSTFPYGINDSGLISGTALSDGNAIAVGFLYDGKSFKTLRAPGKSATLP